MHIEPIAYKNTELKQKILSTDELMVLETMILIELDQDIKDITFNTIKNNIVWNIGRYYTEEFLYNRLEEILTSLINKGYVELNFFTHEFLYNITSKGLKVYMILG